MDEVEKYARETETARKEWIAPVVEEFDVESVTASGPAGFFDAFSFS